MKRDVTLKIISGKLKGRNITGYDIIGTRPTMDRVKESLFAIIQGYLKDSIVIDLFSGSGNLGIEALSNDAKYCYFNDKNNKCFNLIKNNIKSFNLEDSSFISNYDYHDALGYYRKNEIKADIIFLDPPYKMECLNEIINYIYDNKLIKPMGIIICESDSIYFYSDHYENIKNKKYGDKYITIYQNNVGNNTK